MSIDVCSKKILKASMRLLLSYVDDLSHMLLFIMRHYSLKSLLIATIYKKNTKLLTIVIPNQ